MRIASSMLPINRRAPAAWVAAASIVSLGVCHQTLAANAENEVRTLEEVVVTAQKRAERLQDVPISISVLSGDDLDALTSGGVSETLNRVPGVATTVSRTGGETQLSVRGVTAGNALFNGSSPVAYYLDTVPFGLVKTAAVPDVNPYDLERVEVLRGPQGTLYGASAQNGVVRVLTRDADLDEFEFKARTSASTTEGGSGNYRVDAAINVPLVSGKLAVRAVGGYEDLSGWISRPNEHNANSARNRNMRLKVNAQPTENLSLGVSAWASRSDQNAPPVSLDGVRSIVLRKEPLSSDYDVFGLNIGYDFSVFSLTSTTSYIDYANRSINDFLVLNVAPIFTGIDSQIFTQELNLTSTGGEAWRWSLGAIYRDGEDRLRQTLPGFIPAPIDFYDLSESFAVYGEITRVFQDGRFEITAGMRHFEDDVTNGENVLSVATPRPLYLQNSKFDADSPRIALTWHPTSQLTVYTSYAEGFRSGFPQNANAAIFPPLEADNLRNYEIGAKGGFPAVSLDVAVYYIDWQDVQQTLSVQVPGGSTFATALVNGRSASGIGAEFALTGRPVEGLTLGASFGWNDLAMDAEVRSGATSVLLFDEGDRLNLSPEYTAAASVEYVFPLGAGSLEGGFSASANYISELQTRGIVAGRTVLVASDTILISRVNFSVGSPERWTATLFVDNANNERDATTRSQSSPALTTWTRPRTYGLQLEYRF